MLSNEGLPPGYNFIVPVSGAAIAPDELPDTVALVGGELLWNVTVGCTGGSPACQDCSAKAYWERWSRSTGYYVDADSWSNVIAYQYAVTDEPAKWPQEAQRILVAPAGDLFNDKIPDGFIDRVLAVMQRYPQHTFYIVTKRVERMKSYLASRARGMLAAESRQDAQVRGLKWPLPNVRIGVSCENQKTYMARVRALIETPAAKRFVVIEPMLGPVRLDQVPLETRDVLWPLKGIVQAYQGQDAEGRLHWEPLEQPLCQVAAIDWVVVGGYRGKAVKPMHPHWVREIRQSCQREGVPFHFKGWGDYAPAQVPDLQHDTTLVILSSDGTLRGRGVGSATNFLSVQIEGPAPDAYMSRRCENDWKLQLDGRRYQDMPGEPRKARVRLADTSDVARMLHRLSNANAELSGPLTGNPQAQVESGPAFNRSGALNTGSFEPEKTRVGERVKEAATWFRDTLTKPIF